MSTPRQALSCKFRLPSTPRPCALASFRPEARASVKSVVHSPRTSAPTRSRTSLAKSKRSSSTTRPWCLEELSGAQKRSRSRRRSSFQARSSSTVPRLACNTARQSSSVASAAAALAPLGTYRKVGQSRANSSSKSTVSSSAQQGAVKSRSGWGTCEAAAAIGAAAEPGAVSAGAGGTSTRGALASGNVAAAASSPGLPDKS